MQTLQGKDSCFTVIVDFVTETKHDQKLLERKDWWSTPRRRNLRKRQGDATTNEKKEVN